MPRISLSGVRTTRTTITAGNADKVTKEWLVAYTAETATQMLKAFQGMNRFPKDRKEFLTIVDRKHGHGREYAVRPGGRIIYQNNQSTMNEVLDWIWDKINKITYEKSGNYKRHHRILVDGKDFVGSGASVSRWGSGALPDKYRWDKVSKNTAVTFLNDEIYARRIERGGYIHGETIKKPWSRAMPSGVYRAVARAAKQRFGQTVRIDFKYIKLASSRTVTFKVRDTKRGSRKMGQILTAEAMYPSIRVRPRTTSLGTMMQ